MKILCLFLLIFGFSGRRYALSEEFILIVCALHQAVDTVDSWLRSFMSAGERLNWCGRRARNLMYRGTVRNKIGRPTPRRQNLQIRIGPFAGGVLETQWKFSNSKSSGLALLYLIACFSVIFALLITSSLTWALFLLIVHSQLSSEVLHMFT